MSRPHNEHQHEPAASPIVREGGASIPATLTLLTRARARQRAAVAGLWLWLACVLGWFLPNGQWSAARTPAPVAALCLLGFGVAGVALGALYRDAGHFRPAPRRAPRRMRPSRQTLLTAQQALWLALAAALYGLPVLATRWWSGGAQWPLLIPAGLALTQVLGRAGALSAAVAGCTLYLLIADADGHGGDTTALLALAAAPLMTAHARGRFATQTAGAVAMSAGSTRIRRLPTRQETAASSLARAATDLVIVMRADGTPRAVGPASDQILGYEPDELVGADLFSLVHPDDRPPLMERLLTALAQPGVRTAAGARFQARDRSWRYLDGYLTNLLADAEIGGVVLSVQDATERKQHEAQLARQALYDALTGLPNRRLFSDRLAQALERQQRTSDTLAVVYLDLDDFKRVNDTWGHATGDALLMDVGRRLCAGLRAQDTPARFGGDEFVVLLEHLACEDEAVTVVERVLAGLIEPFTVAGVRLTIRASAGIATGPRPGEPAEMLLQRADTALYRAKAAGKGHFKIG